MTGSGIQRFAASQPWLDSVADAIQPRLQEVLGRRPRLRDALDGRWLGAPLHPVLTDVPIGAWTVALLLDRVEPDRRRGAVSGGRRSRDRRRSGRSRSTDRLVRLGASARRNAAGRLPPCGPELRRASPHPRVARLQADGPAPLGPCSLAGGLRSGERRCACRR